VDETVLRARVDEVLAATGRDLRPWPDPHPDHGAPAEEEYSRLLDPGKYLIVAARVEAWAHAVTDLGLAVRSDPDPAEIVWEASTRTPGPHAPTRAIRLTPRAPEAWPLVLCLGAIGGVPDAALVVGVGDPTRPVTQLPDCGCDACDSGSDDLLEELDEWLIDVVTGSLVLGPGIIAGRLRSMSWSTGQSASAVEAAVATTRAGGRVEGFSVGVPWG
jgi:hypothetical protein